MTTETTRINWPPALALLRSGKEIAHQLRFLKEEIVEGKFEVSPMAVPQGLLAFKHKYSCFVTDAYYLPWILLRPLEGNFPPKGKLSVFVDKELAIEGKISDFLPDANPFSCMESRSWKKTENLFTAHCLVNEQAVKDHQTGFMLPNKAVIEVYLSEVEASRKVPLEIILLSALYTTKKEKGPHE